MRSHALWLTALLLVTVAQRSAQGQVVDTLDLADGPDLGSTRISQRDFLRIVLQDVAPRAKYTIKTVFEEHPIDPLPVTAIPSGVFPHAPAAPHICAFTPVAQQLDAALDEQTTKEKLAILRKADLSGCDQAQQDSINRIIAKTYQSYSVGKLGDADVTVTITREATAADGTSNSKTWTKKYTTPHESPWVVTYGVGFNRTADERYYAKQLDATHYQLVRRRRAEDYDIVPAVQFTYRHTAVGPLDWGVTSGIGASKDQFALLLGLSVGLGQNLWATAGVINHPYKILNTQYKGGGLDTVSTQLDESQLAEVAHRNFAFVGLAFRFSSSPFGNSSDTGKSAAADPSATAGPNGARTSP